MTSGTVNHFTPIYLNSTFVLKNRNFYSTTFSDLHFGLYSLQLGTVGGGHFAGPVTVPALHSVTIETVGAQMSSGKGAEGKVHHATSGENTRPISIPDSLGH